MCWEMHYHYDAEAGKSQEARIKQKQRAGRIENLLKAANKAVEKSDTEAPQAPEIATAK